ncbi:hypothetical protein [Desulfopila aestuarii]|uniref:Surface antigen domain-containing protein n=1 Tax=Desulfopila aestuarii DSM 18488 TaxID=1121416 RepID=A0A1M7Y6F7_9BACT|nr:hypothetical protein [Desulfopila aestuarii]SHO48096.1 hypothetical protein SAMN02745220_02125 [Desulfopila aestuarii DSM 18488]
MDNTNIIPLQKSLIAAVVGVAALILSGCAGPNSVGTPLSTSAMAPAPLPAYYPGDSYVYSDGTWEQVEEVNGARVSWVNYQGSPSSGPADFIYPRSEWQNSKRRGERWFKQDTGLFAGSATGLWPLKDGNSTSFNEYGRSVAKNGGGLESTYDNYWRCSVDGAKSVSVGAGTFDSWRITCTRYSDDSGSARKRPWEYRTWYYAPDVNHWILELRDYTSKGKEDRRKELVAVMPDLTRYTRDRQVLNAMKRNFQQALEENSSGTKASYTSSKDKLTVTTTPIKTLKHTDGKVCRQYKQVIAAAGDTHAYYGIACRESSGGWKIPRR